MDLNEPLPGAARALHGIAAHDHASWAWLCDRYASRVLGIARAIVGDDDGDDACQEVFLRLHRHAARFPGAGSDDAHAEAWVRRVAVNTCLSWHARRRQRQGREIVGRITEGPAMDSDPITPADQTARYRAVLDALAALGESDRALVTRRFWDGTSHEDLARELGVKASALRVRLHRALSRLRRSLAAVGVVIGADALGAEVTATVAAVGWARAAPASAGLVVGLSSLPARAARQATTRVVAVATALLALSVVTAISALRMSSDTPEPLRIPAVTALASTSAATTGTPEDTAPAPPSARDETMGIAVTRKNGPAIRLRRAASSEQLGHGEVLEEGTTRSLVLSWPVAGGSPTVHRGTIEYTTVEGGSTQTRTETVEFYLDEIPPEVAAMVPDLQIVNSPFYAPGTPPPANLSWPRPGSSGWFCGKVTRSDDRFDAILVPAGTIGEWVSHEGVIEIDMGPSGTSTISFGDNGEFLGVESNG